MWHLDDAPPAVGEPREVAPGVIGLLAPNANPWTYEGTNTWVVIAGDDAVVIDPGPEEEPHLDAIDRVVTEAGARVREVVLTHHHGDHSHGATQLAQRWRAPIRPRVQRGLLTDGSLVRVGRRSALRVLRTPGHTADGVSFLVEGQSLLLTGDTVLARFNPFISHPDGTIADMLASMRRLAGVVGDDWMLLPGHGPLVDTPRSYLLDRTADRHRRIRQVAEVLADGVPPDQVADVVYAKVDGIRMRAARASVEAIVHYLDTRSEPAKEIS